MKVDELHTSHDYMRHSLRVLIPTGQPHTTTSRIEGLTRAQVTWTCSDRFFGDDDL